MKNKIVALTMALAAIIFLGWSPAIVTAATENANSTQKVQAPLPALENVKKIDLNLPNETILIENSDKLPELMTDQNITILESYGVNSKSNVVSVKEIKDNQNDRYISEVQYNDQCLVGFDKNNNIILISNFNHTNCTTASLKDMINNIEVNSNIKDGYKLVNSEAFDNDYWQLEWEKDIGDGILNPNDSLKVVLNRKDNSIAVFNRFEMMPNTSEPNISKEEALAAAQPVLSSISKITSTTISQSVIRPNYFWNDGGPYQKEASAKLAYVININNGEYLIYIDSVTGTNLGGDESKKNGKAFAWTGFSFAAESASLARTGMSGLGYNALSSWVGSGSSMGTSINSYWSGSSSYGFYVDCHGSSTSIGDNSTWSLSTSNVTGNWNLVFLDACSTGASTAWARAFKIYGYSGRAFLGWYQGVEVTPAYEFNTYFWPEAVNMNHSNNIRDAAVWAASQVSGSTPIRFYGDSSYNGRV
ncbi:MAG: hypothetical protein WA125_13635 [Desulfosporosinus sp.]